MSGYDIVNGYSNQFTGLYDYFVRCVTGTAKWPRYASTYSYTAVQNHIKANRPVMLGTVETGHPQISNHHVIVHGYRITTSDEYLIVNDGFGSNNVYFTALPQYYLGYVYIN